MIIYFSGTGNSRYCAQMLADMLGDEITDSFGYIKNNTAADLGSEEPWVFVCPVYAWRMPRIFDDFIRRASFRGSGEAYFVITCGGDIGNAGEGAAELCREKGLKLRGVLEAVMPENYLIMFPVPDEEKSAGIIAGIRSVMEEAACRIRERKAFDARKVSPADRAKSGFINKGFYKMYVRSDKFYTNEKCTFCGRCVQLCPLNNITLNNGRPVWNGSCTHCMACICRCPSGAVEYGKKSASRRRYLCPEYEKDTGIQNNGKPDRI